MTRLHFLLVMLVMTSVIAGFAFYVNQNTDGSNNVLVVEPDIVPVSTSTVPAVIENENGNSGSTTAPSTPVVPNTPSVPALKPPVTPEPNPIAPSIVGILEEVNTGCFSDGECYAVVAGKHVTLLMGWYSGPLGKIIGAESIGDLEAHIGEVVTVYAGQDATGNFTLQGSDLFYLQVPTGSGTSTGGDNGSGTKPVVGAGCAVGGCSSQICGEATKVDDMVTTCEWTQKYSCYQKATCERQATGQCAWTPTAELNMCLRDAQ